MKIKKNQIAFYAAYCLFFVSLFVRDIGGEGFIVNSSRYIRFLSYGIIAIQLIAATKFNAKRLFRIFALLLATTIYGLYTGDLYWSILLLFIVSSRDIEEESILSISFRILIIGTIIVVAFGFIGILPDIINSEGSSSIVLTRHSLGFYHSNVLPLIVLYMEIYYIILHKNRPRFAIIVCFVALSILAFLLCGSRNAFYLSILLSIMVLCKRLLQNRKSILSILYIVSKCSVLVLSVFSIAMMFLVIQGGVWDKIDTIFSGRFRLGLFKMGRVGLHFINFMPNSDFFSDSITYVTGRVLDTVVLDNGYLYITLRYGIIALLFYFAVSILLANKAKGTYCFLVTLIILFIANFIDNDLVDYSFLPLIVFAFSRYRGNDLLELFESINGKRSK